MTVSNIARCSDILATGAMLFLIATLSPFAVVEPTLQSYVGQPPPGMIPELFAPGVVSTDAVELNSVFPLTGASSFSRA